MITPSPTNAIDPGLARGTFNGTIPASGAAPGHIVLAIPNTSYEIGLLPQGEIRAEVGKRLIGTIRARSRRIDRVQTGGRYIEPIYGKPRRIQGTVVGEEAGALVINATVPFHITCGDPRQKPSDFQPGDLVALDLPEWPTFTPA